MTRRPSVRDQAPSMLRRKSTPRRTGRTVSYRSGRVAGSSLEGDLLKRGHVGNDVQLGSKVVDHTDHDSGGRTAGDAKIDSASQKKSEPESVKMADGTEPEVPHEECGVSAVALKGKDTPGHEGTKKIDALEDESTLEKPSTDASKGSDRADAKMEKGDMKPKPGYMRDRESDKRNSRARTMRASERRMNSMRQFGAAKPPTQLSKKRGSLSKRAAAADAIARRDSIASRLSKERMKSLKSKDAPKSLVALGSTTSKSNKQVDKGDTQTETSDKKGDKGDKQAGEGDKPASRIEHAADETPATDEVHPPPGKAARRTSTRGKDDQRTSMTAGKATRRTPAHKRPSTISRDSHARSTKRAPRPLVGFRSKLRSQSTAANCAPKKDSSVKATESKLPSKTAEDVAGNDATKSGGASSPKNFAAAKSKRALPLVNRALTKTKDAPPRPPANPRRHFSRRFSGAKKRPASHAAAAGKVSNRDDANIKSANAPLVPKHDAKTKSEDTLLAPSHAASKSASESASSPPAKRVDTKSKDVSPVRKLAASKGKSEDAALPVKRADTKSKGTPSRPVANPRHFSRRFAGTKKRQSASSSVKPTPKAHNVGQSSAPQATQASKRLHEGREKEAAGSSFAKSKRLPEGREREAAGSPREKKQGDPEGKEAPLGLATSDLKKPPMLRRESSSKIPLQRA